MILNGIQRGGAMDLASHLMKDENEHIEISELRGFASQTLEGAFKEAYAVSRGTKCKQFLFSLSLNPPQGEKVTVEAFERAIDKVEEKLGLQGCARAVVFHEKEGRRHAHAVWSRIDPTSMKAVQLSFSKLKLREVSKELFREHGWTMPQGLVDSRNRDPRNFTLEQWQQAKRHGRDPREIKTSISDAWAISDTKSAFEHALAERGFELARGDRRGFVAVDHEGEVYSIPRWTDLKTKAVRERLGSEAELPSIAEANAQFAKELVPHLEELRAQETARHAQEMERFRAKAQKVSDRHKKERQRLDKAQAERWKRETQRRQERHRKGLPGLWDRISGRRAKVVAANELEAYQALKRDRAERDDLVFQQLEARQAMQAEKRLIRTRYLRTARELTRDIARLNAPPDPEIARQMELERERINRPFYRWPNCVERPSLGI